MKLEYRIRVLAGTMILASLALAHFFGPWWLLLAAFILGALGVLDDVTVTQATTVDELSLQRGLVGRRLWVRRQAVNSSEGSTWPKRDDKPSTASAVLPKTLSDWA